MLMADQNLRVQRPIPFPISLRPPEGPDQMAGNPLLIPQDAIEPPLAQFLDAEHREAREAKAAAAIQPDMHVYPWICSLCTRYPSIAVVRRSR